MRFVDVQNDVAFHRIFGKPGATDASISFLNAVLFPEDANRVEDVNVLHPYFFPPIPAGKTSIINLEITDKHGAITLVEMLVADQEGFGKRKYFYDCVERMRILRGDDHPLRKPTCLVCILDFDFTVGADYFSIVQTTAHEVNKRLFRNVMYVFIELGKFDKQADQLVTPVDKWTYFIKNAHNLNDIPSIVDDLGLKAAYQAADKSTWTQAELRAYDDFYVYLTDLKQRELFLQNHRGDEEEAFKVGRKKAVIEMVQAMHQSGLTIPQIAAISGKSEAEVAAIIAMAE